MVGYTSTYLPIMYPEKRPKVFIFSCPKELQRGRKIHWRWEKLGILTEIAVYLGNGSLRDRPWLLMER